MSEGQDPLFLQHIISKYETEEDDFLREIESMQQCTTSTDISDVEESPVLGTLCSLVSEITDLRKQNRKLRRRLILSASLSPPARPNRASGMVNRMSAVFMDSRDKLLPKFKFQTSNSFCNNARAKKHSNEIRTGARERMSSPPPKDTLTTSYYSTSPSSDTVSSYTPRRSHNYTHRKPPPLVLPESSDSDAEIHDTASPFTEYNASTDKLCLLPYDDDSQQPDSKNFFTLSDQTSASSTSNSSCNEISSVMAESRSSILDFFGLRRKRNKPPVSPVPFASKISIKTRKRRIVDTADSSRSTVHKSVPYFQREDDHLSSSSLNYLIEPPPNIKANEKAPPLDTPNVRLNGNVDNDQVQSTKLPISPVSALTTKHVSKSGSNVVAEGKVEADQEFHYLFNESKNNCDDEEGEKEVEKKRLKSVIYLDPGKEMIKTKLRAKAKSTKSLTLTMDDLPTLENSIKQNKFLKSEIELLHHRNNRLIEQLRIKSGLLSKCEGIRTTSEREMLICRQKTLLNAALDKLCLKDRLSMSSRTVMKTLEVKLFEFDKRLQAIRQSADENQKTAIDTVAKEQQTYQAQLEQIEHLQRENLSLVQLRSSKMNIVDNILRQKLELMPSYDAMYSFAMGIVRKLTQLRTALLEKSGTVVSNELEIMHLQLSLLIAETKTERLRHQVHMLSHQEPRRRASFHGENLIDKIVKPQLNFYLPLREYGAKIERQRRAQSTNINQLAEISEQNIETEFLRLFDYARTLSNTAPPIREVLSVKREPSSVFHHGPMHTSTCSTQSPVVDRRRGLNVTQPGKPVRLTTLRDKDIGYIPVKRPMSLVETKDQKSSGNIRKFGEEMHKLQQHDVVNAQKYNDYHGLSVIRMTPGHKLTNCTKSGHVKAIVSSLQDVRHFQSPTTTPILARKLPLNNNNNNVTQSPKPQRQRRLVKQLSLQHPPGIYEEHEKEPPMYDSPPRHGETSDYHAINHQMSASTGSANQSMLLSTASNGITRKASVERRVPLQKKQLNQPQVQFSRLPQLAGSSTPVIDFSRGSGVFTRVHSGSKSPYLGQASPRHNPVNAPTRSSTTSPLIQRLPIYQQPNILSAFQQNLHSYSAHHEQTIKEEDEPRSISVSETSIATTIERISAPSSSSAVANVAPSNTSRLPKFSPQLERAKKAGSSWLNKLRGNSKK